MSSAHRLTWSTTLLLLVPPLMWAGNAVVGRLAAPWIPPVTFNFLRWVIAFVLLLPLASWVFKRDSPLWSHWKRFGLMGLLAIAGYNALQYQALQTSTPVNVTLMFASMPIWMLLVGRLGFSARITLQAVLGAVFSAAGVVVVMTQGQLDRLQAIEPLAGDLWMLVAMLVWSIYSWLLTSSKLPATIKNDWAALLLAQMGLGLFFSAAMAAVEFSWLSQQLQGTGQQAVQWSWALGTVLLFVAVGPSLLAYRCWGAAVGRAGPTLAGIFSNLTPLFAAVLSLAFLGEAPKTYHAGAFGLIVLGIVVSSWRKR
jgi:drug/metabolite transporter (DMT)-like permease